MARGSGRLRPGPGAGGRSGFALALAAAVGLAVELGCAAQAQETLVVTASAYNSTPAQTRGNPRRAAWGDMLEPGMRAIAVSRDLIKIGLTHGVEVEIEGLPGTYRVLDKMARRWKKKIDIYMGEDVEAAREWGVREVEIRWSSPDDESS